MEKARPSLRCAFRRRCRRVEDAPQRRDRLRIVEPDLRTARPQVLASVERAMTDLDAIIIGAGHNGLTCAAYRGMAGLRVRVLERRDVVGGACVTEEFHPGFRNSTAAYTVGLLQPKVIRDLKLTERGLRVVNRRAQNFLPLPDGRYLLTGEGRTEREIAKFSAKDAARYGGYQA